VSGYELDAHTALFVEPNPIVRSTSKGDAVRVSVYASLTKGTSPPGHRIPLHYAKVVVEILDVGNHKTYWVTGTTGKDGFFIFDWYGFKKKFFPSGLCVNFALVRATVTFGYLEIGESQKWLLIVPEELLSTMSYDPLMKAIGSDLSVYGKTSEGNLIESLITLDTYPDYNVGMYDKLIILLVAWDLIFPWYPPPFFPQFDAWSSITKLRDDLNKEGYRARILVSKVYSGTTHQDGNIVLAIRSLFQQVYSTFPKFKGVVLIGHFPEATIIRKGENKPSSSDLVYKDYSYDGYSGHGDYEVLASRSDIVLGDLQGNWDNVYYSKVDVIPSAFSLHDVFCLRDDSASTTKPNLELCSKQKYLIQANDIYTEYKTGSWTPQSDSVLESYERFPGEADLYFKAMVADGSPKVNGTRLLMEDSESNPLAIPTILVSRINPTRMEKPPYDRMILIDYLYRNHNYRTGGYAKDRKFLGVSFDNNIDPVRWAFAEDTSDIDPNLASTWSGEKLVRDAEAFVFESFLIGIKASLVDIHTHGDSGGLFFHDDDELPQSVLPGLDSSLQGHAGKFFFTCGCRVHALPYYTHAYNSFNGYHASIAEGLLFYCKGLAVTARAKIESDTIETMEFCRLMRWGHPIGETWRANLLHARREKQGWLAYEWLGMIDGAPNPTHDYFRKKDYAWHIVGDWTLKLNWPYSEYNKMPAYSSDPITSCDPENEDYSVPPLTFKMEKFVNPYQK
jgi:hypothetical protein